MADFSLPGVLGPFADIASSQTAGAWVTTGVNLLVSTIVSGIIILVVAEIISKSSGESINAGNAFLFALVINIINGPIVFGLIGGFIALIPYGLLLFPLIVWIVMIKVFFSAFSWKHVLIMVLVGYGASIFVTPYLSAMVMGFIPSFGM